MRGILTATVCNMILDFSVKKRGMVNEKIPAYGCSFWELLLFGLSPISVSSQKMAISQK